MMFIIVSLLLFLSLILSSWSHCACCATSMIWADCNDTITGTLGGMGTIIPVVIRSWVQWVWVWYWYLAYHVPVPRYHRYFMGILQQGEHNFYCFKTCFFSYLIIFSVVSQCHTMTQPNIALPVVRASLLLTILFSLPLPSHINKPSKFWSYIKNQPMVHIQVGIPCF